MRSATLLVLLAVVAAAVAAGQYYVPRAYYTIDSDGRESLPVPLRRLRRSLSNFYPGFGSEGLGYARAERRAERVARGAGQWGVPASPGNSPVVIRTY